LGPRDIAAYLHTPLPETLHPTDDFRKRELWRRISSGYPINPASDVVAMKKQT